MTLQLTFRKTTKKIIDDILDHSENLEQCLAAGSYRNTGALALLKRDQLVHILNDARIKYPEEKDTAIVLARYVVQAEYQKRNGQVEKSAQTLQHLYDHMKLRNLKFVVEGAVDDLDTELENENTMAEETTATTTKAETPAKKAAKTAGSKAAKKSASKSAGKPAGKSAGLAKAAAARKQKAAERKSRLENQIIHLKKMASEDELPTQAIGILKCLKAGSGKLVASTLVERLGSYIETKQSPMAIWSFYRARLIDNGYVTVEDARE